MSVELFHDLKDLIDNAQHPVLAVVLAEGCENFKGKFLTDFETQVQNQFNPVHLHIICYREEPPVFPRPLTQAVYYFAPKNYTPLFFRHGMNAMSVATDIVTALKMMEGRSYVDAAYEHNQTMHAQYQETEQMIKTEDTTQFPSLFQQARNFAKEMWHTGKNAAAGLPVLVDADTAFQRFSMCQGCEFLKTDNFRCEKCGCFMKTKTQLASASCPIGKWHVVTPQKQTA
jgi:hypothetical protein